MIFYEKIRIRSFLEYLFVGWFVFEKVELEYWSSTNILLIFHLRGIIQFERQTTQVPEVAWNFNIKAIDIADGRIARELEDGTLREIVGWECGEWGEKMRHSRIEWREGWCNSECDIRKTLIEHRMDCRVVEVGRSCQRDR